MSYSYQDSKVEWLGKIPNHWLVTKLKNQCQIIPSNVDKKSHDNEIKVALCNYVDVYYNDFINDSLDFMIATASEHELKKFQLIEEDVLITKDSEDPYDIAVPALVVFAQSKLLCGYHLSIIRSNNQNFNGSYLFWALRDAYIASQFYRQATGITRWAIANKHVKNCTIPFPPISEQKMIAAYLNKTCTAINKAIEAKQKQLKILDTLRKSIIHKAVTRGLDDSVELKDSGVEWMPQKPEHWKTCRIKDAVDFFNTQRVPLSADIRGVMNEKKYDYYGASGIIDKVNDYLFDGTYILIAEDGANLLMRNSPLAFLATGKFWVNNHAHIIKPRFGNDHYFVYLFESLDYSLYVTGAAQPKLTKENLGKYKIIIPPRNEQNIISIFLDNKIKVLNSLAGNIVIQISTLNQYRKSLIHECVTGKRRVNKDDVQEQL